MKVLLVKLSPIESNDSATIRTIGLAKGLVGLDCEVDYLTIPASRTHCVTNSNHTESIKIIRSGNNSAYDAVVKQNGRLKKTIVGLLRKVYHAVSLYDYTYFIAKNINISLLGGNEYDLVISSSDPKTSHIAVRKLIDQGLKYKKWIQYWGDPMTLDITDNSIYPKYLIRKIEEKLFYKADRIVYVSPFTLEKQKELFPVLEDKMTSLPIPYLEERLYTNGDIGNKAIRLGYFGDYYSRVRNIVPLYETCKNAGFELIVTGNSDILIEDNDNISIYPRVSQLKVEELERECDVLVCLLNITGTQIPGKLYHYAATNKPILVLLDGERKEDMRKYFDMFDRYVLCDNNEESIKAAIAKLIESNRKYEPSAYFEPKTIADQFLQLV
ncbi:hypothetical protein [Lutispora sp.]|uniref:hypothetical protein n=1 Tax=Lutispora sp. TaxID=2828727 RepID=UPI00356571DA